MAANDYSYKIVSFGTAIFHKGKYIGCVATESEALEFILEQIGKD